MQLLTDFCCALKLSIMPDSEGKKEREREREGSRERVGYLGELFVRRQRQQTSFKYWQQHLTLLPICVVCTHAVPTLPGCMYVCVCVLESRKQEGSYDKEVILCAANFLTYRKLS